MFLNYGTVVYTTNEVVCEDYSNLTELEESLKRFEKDHAHENYYISIYTGNSYAMGQDPIIVKKNNNNIKE